MRRRTLPLLATALVALTVTVPAASGGTAIPTRRTPSHRAPVVPEGCAFFPADNIWNTDVSQMLFHWQYLNETMKARAPGHSDQVGVFLVDVYDARRAAEVCHAIDAIFANSLAETLTVLRENNFSGCVSLEWEKMWHPYLPPLREALGHLRKQPWFTSFTNEDQLVAVTH